MKFKFEYKDSQGVKRLKYFTSWAQFNIGMRVSLEQGYTVTVNIEKGNGK